MNILVIIQIVCVFVLIGVRIYQYYHILSNNSKNNFELLLNGKVLSVSKTTSYIKAYLTLNLKLEDGSTLAVMQEYRNTLRWWLQKIPKVNDTVYFYCSREKFEKRKNKERVKVKGLHNEKVALSVYGINSNQPCSKSKKVYDLLYKYETQKGFLFLILAGILIYFGMTFGKPDVLITQINFILLMFLFINFLLISIIL